MITAFRFISALCVLVFLFGCSRVERPINRSNFQDRLPEVTVYVEIDTTYGVVSAELYRNFAPGTVENFLKYVEAGFYDNTVFHRVIPGFIVQGGGMTEDLVRKETGEPILNEASNGLKNERGTLAMARTGDKHSATSQFYFNLKANDVLDHGVRNYGYAVFGRVIGGMDVVDLISTQTTTSRNGMPDVPEEAIFIKSVRAVGQDVVNRGPVLPDTRFRR
ncbi:MAG: peptidyl-prolyl cis-trans isomerase [Opitutales bacterium]|nr:peptidyl-prolyl cis-trans isomerase [Opitutales bacterium]